MQQQLYNALINQNDLNWKNLLYELVETEQMDPWDINITLLTKKYIETIKKMKETDLRISGKVVLAAALLLKVKSIHLIEHDINNLDRLLAQTEENFEDDLFDEPGGNLNGHRNGNTNHFKLIPKQPQPRNRKVSIHELVDALQKAMESKQRYINKNKPADFKMPKRTIDIVQLINDVYNRLIFTLKKATAKTVTFAELVPSERREDKIFTFVPLLYLENQQKIHTSQKKHFGEILIKLMRR